MANATAQNKTNWKNIGRSAAVVTLLVVGTLAVPVTLATRWTENQIFNTTNWVKTITPIPKNQEVASSLADYTVTQIFNGVDVEQKVKDALPEQAAFLAAPISAQVQTLSEKLATQLIQSDQFQSVWVAANQKAQEDLMALGRSNGQRGQQAIDKLSGVNVNLENVRQQLRAKLGITGPALIPDASEIKQQALSISLNLQTKANNWRKIVQTTDALNKIAPLVILAAVLGSVALAVRRRLVWMWFGGVVAVLSLLQLIGVKALRPEVLNLAQNASYKPAIGVIYDQLLATFKHATLVEFGLALLILLISLVSGPYKWAVRLRQMLGLSKLSQSAALRWAGEARSWIAKYAWWIWGGLGAALLLLMAFVTNPTWISFVQAVLLWLAGGSLVYLAAVKRSLQA